MSSTAIAITLGAECQSFQDWPQGQLPAALLQLEKIRAGTFHDTLAKIRSGKSTKKAEMALDVVMGHI